MLQPAKGVRAGDAVGDDDEIDPRYPSPAEIALLTRLIRRGWTRRQERRRMVAPPRPVRYEEPGSARRRGLGEPQDAFRIENGGPA